MKRRPLTRTTPLHRGGPIKPKRRTKKEFERVYGGESRRAFVSALPCAACGSTSGCENHHITNGGTSRKADYKNVIPLCQSCHFAWHQQGRTTLERRFEFSAFAAAVMTEARWIAHKVRNGLC